MGIVDAVMYSGTQAFMRWEYPSQLPTEIVARATAATKRIIRALGYDHGFFNIELVIEAGSGEIKLIEVNPRMASQFSDLFGKVDGIDLHRIRLQLSCGEEPTVVSRAGKYRHATSFVFRKFDGIRLLHPPSPGRQAWLPSYDPDAHLMLYLKRGRALAREMTWLGSHRYAVLNMGGTSEAELMEKYGRVKDHFEFETG